MVKRWQTYIQYNMCMQRVRPRVVFALIVLPSTIGLPSISRMWYPEVAGRSIWVSRSMNERRNCLYESIASSWMCLASPVCIVLSVLVIVHSENETHLSRVSGRSPLKGSCISARDRVKEGSAQLLGSKRTTLRPLCHYKTVTCNNSQCVVLALFASVLYGVIRLLCITSILTLENADPGLCCHCPIDIDHTRKP